MRSLAPAVAIAAALMCGPAAAEETLVVPLTQKPNAQASDPVHNPRYHYDPFVRVRLKNAETGQELDVSGLMDTGADHCVIGWDVVERLGLKPLPGTAYQVRTGAGILTAPFVSLNYRLRDDQGTIVDRFPEQTAHCLVLKEPKIPVILGFVGFIDRFKRVTLRYPDSLELAW